MTKSNVSKLLLTFFILFGCTNQNEPEVIEPEQESVLYQHYPEFQTDPDIQNDHHTHYLLEYLAENPEILGITELQQLHVATPSGVDNPNGRVSGQDPLWEALMADTTVVVKDIITSFFSQLSSSENGRTAGGNCDCISTATGLELPGDLCGCDDNESIGPNNDGNAGGGSNGGSGGSSGGSTIGVISDDPVFPDYVGSGGGSGSGGYTTGNNTNGSSTADAEVLIISNLDLESALTQDPDFYEKLTREDQLSISEAMFWAGWADRLNEIQNSDLRADIQTTAQEYGYLYQYGRDLYDLFEDHLRNPLANGIMASDQRAELVNLRKQAIKSLQGEYMIAIFLPVAEAAKPWIELAIFETGITGIFQAVKVVANVKWGVQLAKVGVNTTSISTLVNRMKNGVKLVLNNSYVDITIGGRNLSGAAIGTTSSSRVAYRINNVTVNEAKAIYNDMTAGRQVRRVEQGGGKYFETVTWGTGKGKRSITFRNHSTSGQTGDPVIEIKMPEIRSGIIELKFFP